MLSDEELSAAWSGGSREAANALSERYYWRVFRFFEARLAWAAEDLTQRTFLLCAESLERIAGSFRGYLFGIARRQLSRALRDQYSDAKSRRQFGDPDNQQHQTRLSVLASRRQEHQMLLQAMNRLSPESQMTLALYYWEDMNAAQLGEVFEISHSAMRSRLAKARQALAEAIATARGPAPVRSALEQDFEGWARSLAEQAPHPTEGHP